MSGFNKHSHLCLIDASGYIFRAYHAMPPLTRNSDGLPVGAINGFCSMIHKLLQELAQAKPQLTHIAAVFDASGQSFRNELYPEYKAHRPPPPEDLIPQFPLTRKAAQAFGLPIIEQQGLEADDIIASYTRMAQKKGARVTIISSDKDLMQLVGENVLMLDTMKNRTIGMDEVKEKFGVAPEKVPDVQALIGDRSDNVPGAPGIGVKTAAKLITDYGTLALLLKAPEKIENKRFSNIIREHENIIRISHQLVCLKTDADLPLAPEAIIFQKPQAEPLISFLKEMEFKALTQRVAKSFAVDVATINSTKTALEPKTKSKSIEQDVIKPIGRAVSDIPYEFHHKDYQTISTKQALQEWIHAIEAQGFVAVDTETDSLDAMSAQLVGLSLATEPMRAAYIPLGHKEGKQIPLKEALSMLKPMLENPAILKIAHNTKYDLLVLRKYAITLTPTDDTMLLSYALDAGRHHHRLDYLATHHFGHKMISYKEVAGSGAKAISFAQVPIAQATAYAAEDADMTLRLHILLRPRLYADKKTTLYETLERPLISVLSDMEEAGIKIDAAVLGRLSKDFDKKIKKTERKAYQLAGQQFNLGSPKQIAEILFDKMGLAGGQKTKTGQWSTNVSVLEDLAARGEELAQTILTWRHLAKLKSTYTDALPNFINAKTKRVHTSFAMASTSTGRLSSSEPNLQNIPIRSDEGRQIRRAFIANHGARLISADYSQIELRLLAHIADVVGLKQAFLDNLDIHAITASEIFNIPIETMDSNMRRSAKAINFGIIYGISPFGLGRQLGIPVSEADIYIKSYFQRFPEIKAYMENIKQQVRARGYVETVFGRRCHFPLIRDKNTQRRNFAVRAAINAPIQGSAADLIRRAMIAIPPALAKAKLKTTMLLQVHDELVFEAPLKEVARAQKIIKKVMENAALPAIQLSVPLEVSVNAAKNWDEAH